MPMQQSQRVVNDIEETVGHWFANPMLSGTQSIGIACSLCQSTSHICTYAPGFPTNTVEGTFGVSKCLAFPY